MKAVVAAFNQEKALVGAFSVITSLRMELFEALMTISWPGHGPGLLLCGSSLIKSSLHRDNGLHTELQTCRWCLTIGFLLRESIYVLVMFSHFLSRNIPYLYLSSRRSNFPNGCVFVCTMRDKVDGSRQMKAEMAAV